MPPAPTRSRTILVVEDDTQVRELHRATLREAGYSVVAVEDGFDALRYLDSHDPPAAVVLDLHLPRLPGRDVQREMAARGIEAPIVVVTGSGGPIDERDFASILRKPITTDSLLDAVEACLRNRRYR